MTERTTALNIDVGSFALEASPQTPEERLMVALLEEALTTFERGLHSLNPITRQQSREVDEWVRSRDDDHLYSFESVCGILGLDADYLRAGLAVMKRNARTTPLAKLIHKRYRTRITARRMWKGRIG